MSSNFNMKQRILDSIKDYIRTLETMFRISAAEFVKEKFPKLVNEYWEEGKTDDENRKEIRDAFERSVFLVKMQGHDEAAKVISIYLEGWFDKIK